MPEGLHGCRGVHGLTRTAVAIDVHAGWLALALPIGDSRCVVVPTAGERAACEARRLSPNVALPGQGRGCDSGRQRCGHAEDRRGDGRRGDRRRARRPASTFARIARRLRRTGSHTVARLLVVACEDETCEHEQGNDDDRHDADQRELAAPTERRFSSAESDRLPIGVVARERRLAPRARRCVLIDPFATIATDPLGYQCSPFGSRERWIATLDAAGPRGNRFGGNP